MKIEEIEPIEEEIGSLKAGFQNADFKLEFWLAVGLEPISDWLLKIFSKGWMGIWIVKVHFRYRNYYLF